MHRHPMTLLLPVLLLCGCASNPNKVEHSHPPVDQALPLPIESLSDTDQLPYTHAFYGDLVEGQSVQDGETFELPRSTGMQNDPCNYSVLACTRSFVAMMVVPVIVVPLAIVALPFIAAKQKKEREAAVAAAAAGSAADTDSGAQADPVIESGSAVTTEMESVASSSPEQRAQWLAAVVLDGQWSTSLDNAYISALYEALAWTPPVPGGESGRDGAQSANERQFRAGISKVTLLEASTGAQTLMVCARFLLQQGSDSFRYFETCDSTAFALAAPRESPSSTDALKSALVDAARKVSKRQAKALTGQRQFAQGRW